MRGRRLGGRRWGPNISILLLRLASLRPQFRRNKLVIELLLLIGIQNRANLQIGVDHQTATALLHIVPQFNYLPPGLLHHVPNLFALGRIETQRAIHPLNQVAAGHSQQPVTIRERTAGESDRETRDQRSRK